MKTTQNILAIAALGVMAAIAPRIAMAESYELAQDRCQVIGQQLAQERGAQLLAASQTNAGTRAACEVVLLTQSRDGGRPRREVVVVPQ
ncbi:MAG: hypothetical protein AAGI92_06595 [Pseudomonadota bacterium]